MKDVRKEQTFGITLLLLFDTTKGYQIVANKYGLMNVSYSFSQLNDTYSNKPELCQKYNLNNIRRFLTMVTV